MSSEQLLEDTNQESMRTFIIRRRWKWSGHTLRKDTPMVMAPNSGDRDEEDRTQVGTVQSLARDRLVWRNFVACPKRYSILRDGQ